MKKIIILLPLLCGCSNRAAQAIADIAKANADSKAHVEIIVNMPPNTITYKRWIPGEIQLTP